MQLCVRMTNKMHTLFPLFVSIILSCARFEQVHHHVTSVHAAEHFPAENVTNYVDHLP